MPVGGSVTDGDRPSAERPASGAVPIAVAVAPPLDPFGELVDIIDTARGVHPTGVRVEALVDEELAPGRSAVNVEALVAGDLLLRAEVPARVGVDQEERVAGGGDLRRDGNAVRALAFALNEVVTLNVFQGPFLHLDRKSTRLN